MRIGERRVESNTDEEGERRRGKERGEKERRGEMRIVERRKGEGSKGRQHSKENQPKWKILFF